MHEHGAGATFDQITILLYTIQYFNFNLLNVKQLTISHIVEKGGLVQGWGQQVNCNTI